MNILLDSGSSVSLVRKAALQVAENVRVIMPTTIIKLVTAAGEKLKIFDYVTAPIQAGDRTIEHNIVVVDNLITSVIWCRLHAKAWIGFELLPFSCSGSLQQ